MGALDIPGIPRGVADQRYARTSAPTSVSASGRAGVFDPVRSTYVPVTSALQRFRRAQAARVTQNAALINIVCLGDSKTAGFNATAGQRDAWPTQLRTVLATAGIPAVGTGCVLATNSGMDSRYTVGSGWGGSQTYAQASASGSTITFTSDVPGTVVEVFYYNNSGAFTVSIDGGTAATVTPTGPQTVGKYTASGLSNATHSVAITTTTNTTTYLIAVNVRPTSGLVIHNGAINGQVSASYMSSAGFPSAGFNMRSMVPAPDFLIVALGTNDIGTSVAPATYATNMAGIRSGFGNPATLWIAQSNTQKGSAAQWAPYVSVVYDLADSTGMPLLDLAEKWGTSVNAQAMGFLGDNVHETTDGHADVARSIAQLLSA